MESMVAFPTPPPPKSLHAQSWGEPIRCGGQGPVQKAPGHPAAQRVSALGLRECVKDTTQSNNVIPGGSAGLVETYEEVAGPGGFQGNSINSTSAPKPAKAAT